MRSSLYILAMRIAIMIDAAICIRLTLADSFADPTQRQEAVQVLVICALLAAIVVTWYHHLWVGSFYRCILAGMATMLTSAGGGFFLILVGSVAFGDTPMSALNGIMMVFASGAMLSSVAVLTHPIALIIWFAFAYVIGTLARRGARHARLESLQAYRQRQAQRSASPEPPQRARPTMETEVSG